MQKSLCYHPKQHPHISCVMFPSTAFHPSIPNPSSSSLTHSSNPDSYPNPNSLNKLDHHKPQTEHIPSRQQIPYALRKIYTHMQVNSNKQHLLGHSLLESIIHASNSPLIETLLIGTPQILEIVLATLNFL